MPGKHVRLSPSSAHRWMACPGAPRLESQVPPEKGSSTHAIEGTVAHEIAEECLREGNTDPHDLVGTYVAVEDSEEAVEVTEGMADAVSMFVEYVRGLEMYPGARAEYEKRVSLADLNPPEPLGGTADAIVWQPSDRTLHVVDYKHGRGVVVDVVDNPQVQIYALGAILAFRVRPKQVVVTIVQPRAYHPDGPIRSQDLGWNDVLAFRDHLLERAEAAAAPDAPVGPVGDHCRWCRAKAICPAQRSNALVVAQGEFAALPAAGPPPPESLTTDQLQEVLEKSGYVEDWINSVREYVRRQLEQGKEVPGWKLVAKRAYRRWVDDEEAEQWLRSQKYLVRDIFKKKLISPAQAEKLGDVPDELILSQSSGHNLVPESNPRPAITPGIEAAEEFDAISEES